LRPISPWLLLLAVVVIVAVAGPVIFWLYGIAGGDPARRIEAIKTGLTVAAGTGGAFALLLAFRRQLATEIIAASCSARCAAVARQAARARGKQTGRPRALSADQVRVARRMREAGESVSTICTTLRVARSTLYRAFNDVEQDTEPALAG
jgi:hypothetical protein